jgi:hypothetical protein
MMRVIAAAAGLSLLLGATGWMSAPFEFSAVAIAAAGLFRLLRDRAGLGAARVAAALLVASLMPLTSGGAPSAHDAPVILDLSLLWWAPLIAAAVVSTGWPAAARAATAALAAWWALAAVVTILGPASWGAVASRVETAPAAALAGLAVARLAAVTRGDAPRRLQMIAALSITCVWQSWLVVGAGRPARVLVPMLVAALMIAATDLLTDDRRDGETIGAALVLAMLVLGFVPAAHMVARRAPVIAHAPAPADLPGAGSPSSIAAP